MSEMLTAATAARPADFDPVPLIAAELSLPPRGVAAAVALLAEGSTVPFIARYRKEVTGGLDEVQIRTIEERRAYMLDLEKRRQSILGSISEQGKLSDELRARLLAVTTKTELEDLYLPYKPKRRTRATIAREKGLEPLAARILAQPPSGEPLAEAAAFVDAEKGVADAEAALAGARDIVAEALAENAEIRALVREAFLKEGALCSEVVPEKREEVTKFKDYYEHREPVATVPSHRFLAMRRGENEEVLRVRIEVDAEAMVGRVLRKAGLQERSPFAAQMRLAAQDGFKRLLAPSVETDVRVELKLRSDRDAVEIFASNLRNLLLAAPLGAKAVLGVDPGLRTGCKSAAVDATGKFLENTTLYLSQGDAAAERGRRELLGFVRKHRPQAVAVGNGTGGRETEAFVRKALADEGLREVVVVQVNEAGASVYSASDVAREEFPELDLTVRGAISIARRLQDPLAELVKLDPKAIGVGQYQHDVHQPLLARKLEEVVESCVNHVGVELNTASASLLSYVAGIGPKLAKKIVEHRESHGAFPGRRKLLEVAGLGPRTFEQAAGFLRVRGGKHPLDASAVHPERYALVERIAKDMGVAIGELVGNPALADKIDIVRYTGDGVGEPTLRDIVAELKKPGRDPRATFEPPRFREDVTTMADLQAGMQLEGVVTNVTAFGAFVDVGVHQDGLVHISQLADRYVKDPHEVVKAGDKIQVRVLEVDLGRGRISLTARSGEAPRRGEAPRGQPAQGQQGRPQPGGGPGRAQERGAAQRGQDRGAPQRGQERGPQDRRDSGGLSHNPFADLFKR
jgi:protein Tex